MKAKLVDLPAVSLSVSVEVSLFVPAFSLSICLFLSLLYVSFTLLA